MNKLWTTTAISLAALLASAAPARAERFVVNGNLTVTDTSTGLMWTQDQQGYTQWPSALSACESLVLGGYSDWRLPNVKELFSAYDLSQAPALDLNVFYSYQQSFWTSTTRARGPSDAFFVSGDGTVSAASKGGTNLFTRCVR